MLESEIRRRQRRSLNRTRGTGVHRANPTQGPNARLPDALAALLVAALLPLGAHAQTAATQEAIPQFNQDADSQDDVTSLPTADGEAVQPDATTSSSESAAGGSTAEGTGAVLCDPKSSQTETCVQGESE